MIPWYLGEGMLGEYYLQSQFSGLCFNIKWGGKYLSAELFESSHLKYLVDGWVSTAWKICNGKMFLPLKIKIIFFFITEILCSISESKKHCPYAQRRHILNFKFWGRESLHCNKREEMFKIIFKSLPLHTTPPGRLVSSVLQSFKACYFASKTVIW